MTRLTLLSLTLIAALATPFAVAATDTRTPPAAQASVTPAAPAAPATPVCAKRVKVVYAGYGEAAVCAR